jgi:hypothetical protein
VKARDMTMTITRVKTGNESNLERYSEFGAYK